MKRLLTNSISDTVAMPVKSGTLEFLQDSYKEVANALAIAVIGNAVSNIGYVLYGCKNTGSGANFIISAGAIYFNGEIYLVPAATFTTSGNSAIGKITITNFTTNADPVTFSDGIDRSVHKIRRIVFTAGDPDTADMLYADLLQTQLVFVNDQQATMPASYTVKFDQDRSVFFAAASVDTEIGFDFTNAIPGAVVRLKWTYGASRVLSIASGSGYVVIRDSGNLGDVASADNLMYLLYCGKNTAGNHEVSYTLKQY